MKILVTGATGFIGNHVIQKLLEYKNISVVATSKDIKKAKTFPWFDQVSFISYNIDENRTDDLYNFFEKPDILIHLAWNDLDNYNSLNHIERHLHSHYSFLKNMITNGLKELSITGTCLEYGMINGKLNEEINTNPSNSYAIAKDTLRKFLKELQKSYSFQFKWIRLFYMFGEGQSKKSILSQLQQAILNNEKVFNMSKGEQLRDYLPINEVATNIIMIAQQKSIYGCINCCKGEPISIKTLVNQFIQKHASSIKPNPGFYSYPNYEPMAFWGDNTKLNKIKEFFES